MYDTEENRLKFSENAIDEIARKLSHIIRKCDGIHRVNCVVDLLCSPLTNKAIEDSRLCPGCAL